MKESQFGEKADLIANIILASGKFASMHVVVQN